MTSTKRAKALAVLAQLRHKAKGDILTRIALNGYASSIALALDCTPEEVAVYPFKKKY